jgi:putative DNA modification/repair radical SAM protein
MDTHSKVEMLGRAAQYDVCGEACGTQASRLRDDLDRWIYPAVMPDGKRVKLLKVLQSNACANDCYYCANRVGRDCSRVSFSPDELARAFDQMQRHRLVDGLFLSSAICGRATQTMDRMLATVELVRHKYRFPGYVHLKILPGVTEAHVEQAVRLAHRVSVNLEAPNSERLGRIAPGKLLQELVEPLRTVHRLRVESGGRLAPAGQTTQFVVGASDEPDLELLQTVSQLYREVGLHRAYFSAFQPVPDTPLAEHSATPLWREHRLYQSDFLLRQYGFAFEELVFDETHNLPRRADPKRMWAMAHPERFPVEVNRASREQLLRVPGIGPRSAGRILRWRREGRFRTLTDLKKAGAVVTWAAPFVLLNGKQAPHQLQLWTESVGEGEEASRSAISSPPPALDES